MTKQLQRDRQTDMTRLSIVTHTSTGKTTEEGGNGEGEAGRGGRGDEKTKNKLEQRQ